MESDPRIDDVEERLDQLEKRLTHHTALSIQGVLFSYFFGIQTLFLVFKWTGVIDWNWWFISTPTIMLAATWNTINHIRRQRANNMIRAMKDEIDAIKRHIQNEIVR